MGFGGDDYIDGRGSFDLARYDLVGTGALGIDVDLAAGIVTGRDAAATAVVGTDTLRNVEGVRGSTSADIFDATGYNATSANAASSVSINTGAGFNQFEGMAGDDTIIGNGVTTISYENSTSAVTVNMPPARPAVLRSAPILQRRQLSARVELRRYPAGKQHQPRGRGFTGRNGNDIIDGFGGLDRANYDDFGTSAGITVNLAAGTVKGTLRSATIRCGRSNR